MQPRGSIPPARTLAICMAALLSPTAYFLLLLVADRLQIPSPPEWLVASLFYLIPVIALLVCGFAVWLSGMTVARKVVWMLLTLLAMIIELGVLLLIILSAISHGD